MCAMSRDEQAAPSPDVLATEGRGRCFLSPGGRAWGVRSSQKVQVNRQQQLLQHA